VTRRSQVEKSLGALHALLGETPEAAAAVDIMRDLVSVARPLDGLTAVGRDADACYCVDRVALAVEKALQAKWTDGFNAATAEAPDFGDDDCDDCPRDGEAESALASVYGENE